MAQALKEAEQGYKNGELPIGAVLVCMNTIIARDHNRVEKLQDATAHAELLVLTAGQNYLGAKYLNECMLYTTLEPCVMCAGGIFWTQVARVVIGAKDPQRGFLKFNHKLILPNTKIKCGVLETQCTDLIEVFFKKIRN